MISILIPTYNEEKAIGKTLSLFTTKLTIPHEIIVSDDKSTDATVEIAKKYPVIVLVPEIKHRTIAQNRNVGVRSATSDIFVFIDSDVFIENPDAFFVRALSHFNKDSNLVALTGALKVLPEMRTWADSAVYSVFNIVHHLKNNIFHTGEASGKFQMIRKSAFEKVNGFREDLVTREDGDMFNRLSKIGRTMYDGKLVVFHTGRRAHQVGWPRLLTSWMINTMWVALFNTSKDTEWKAVR